MTDETVLTEDELAFIRQLMLRGASNGEGPTGFRVDGGAKSNELLLQLDERTELGTDLLTLVELRLLESRLQRLLMPSVAPVDGPVGSGFGVRSEEYKRAGSNVI